MDRLLRMRPGGALEPYMHGFAAELTRLGYRPNAAYNQLLLAAGLGRWLDQHGVPLSELTDRQATAFLAWRRQSGYRQWLSEKALIPLMPYLRSVEAIAAASIPAPAAPVDALLGRYRAWLIGERGVAVVTARCYLGLVRPFVAGRDAVRLAEITAADVISFVLASCARHRDGTAKLTVTALRSFLLFLHVDGHLPRPLAHVVPKVARSRLAGVPRGLDPRYVRALMDGCDRGTSAGLRDYAVLAVLSRLGLRAGEVARLRLEEIDWRNGQLQVTGKGNQVDLLPLPTDVGAAIAAYLQHGRPAPVDGARLVFLRARAPHRGLTAGGVSALVRDAALRAGLAPVGAHRLRHTLAEQMLSAGVALPQIGRVLRHRRTLTTAIYAKVDLDGLRTLARPWPGRIS